MKNLEVIILTAAASNFFLGLFVLKNDSSKKLNRLFGIFAFITAIWGVINFFAYSQCSLFFIRGMYAFGALVPVAALFWVLEFCNKRITKFKMILFSILGLFFFLVSYINDLVIRIERIYDDGFDLKMGILHPLYSFYMFGLLISIIYFLASEYRKVEGIKKLQLGYVLTGAIFYISFVLLVSFILPLFGNFKLSPLDSPSSLVLLIFTALAITRYHLFEIKVILTEILVGVMGLVFLIEVLIFKTFWTRIFGFSVFLLFSFIGYLLIKATHRELREKEILEQRVKEKTRELQMAYEDIKKKKEELEKFYKFAVGRELRMIELKKKIKELEEKVKKNKSPNY